MKKTFIALLILTLMFTLAACASEPLEADQPLTRITLVLDWVPNTNHTGLYVAKNLGYYEAEGLDVEIIQPSEGGSADLIAAGQGHFGISYQEQVTYALTAENPLPVKAIAAILQHNTSGFASPAEKGIESPGDFEGRRYGSWGSPMEMSTIEGLMAIDGGDFSQVEVVDIGAMDFFAATAAHVDFTWIYYGWDGIASELRNLPLNFILLQDVDENLDFYTPVIIAENSYLESNPDIARAFLRATEKGYRYAMENPEAAAGELLKDIPEIDSELAKASIHYLKDYYQDPGEAWGVMDESLWINYSRWMQDRGLIEGPLEVSEAYTNEFLPAK